MRIKAAILTTGAFLALCAGCSKAPEPAAAAPKATVFLKDGSSFAGSLTKSDTSGVTVQSVNGETRTYPMAQVSSIQYNNDPAPAPLPLASNTGSSAPPPQYPVAGNPAPQPPAYSPAPAPAYSPAPAPAPEYRPVEEFRTIPAGRSLAVRNNETIDSETAGAGQTWSGVVARDVTGSTGAVAIPRGSNATLVVREARSKGEFQGRSELALDVGSVVVGGRTYRLETSDFVEKGKDGVGGNKRTGKFVGGGAALGGIIGAIAGGGKGAAIGALSGAAAGGVTQTVTRGHSVRVPAESVLTFTLEAPIRIREMR